MLSLKSCVAILIAAVTVAAAQEIPKSSVLDSAQLLNDLKVLASDAMEGRQPGTPGGDKARAFVIERFKASGIVPFGSSYEQAFTFAARGGQRTGVNVVGHIDGRRQPRRYIVVSAHFDHIGMRNGEVFNGADDNASGTAALFALAQYFSKHPPENSLIFAAFDAEESGLRGSQAFVKQPPVELKSIALDLNADMIGRDPNDKLFVVGAATQPRLRPYIEAVAKKAPVKLLMGHEDPKKRDDDWTQDSDHYSFMQAKIPALYIGVEDYAQHHKATDDYETITYTFYVHAVETILQIIEEFDRNLF
jgi:Zn-dependent M28 family amino/carboxypeptidase